MMAISNITVHESLPTGGYEDQLFLDLPPESPHCPVCLLIVREPHVLLCCGTRICQVCIEHTRANKQSCPSCNTEEYTNIFDRKQHRLLSKLQIRCTNVEKGCEWVGELDDQDRHLTNECLYVPEMDNFKEQEEKHEDEASEEEQDMTTAREIDVLEKEIELIKEQLEAHKKEIVHTVPNDLVMLLENATEVECEEVLQYLETFEQTYEAKQKEMLNEFKEGKEEMMKELKMLRESAERLQQQTEEESTEMRKLDEKLNRYHEKFQLQLQTTSLQNTRLILQLKQQLSQMKGPTVPMWYSALIRKSSPSIPPFIVNVTNFTDYKKLNAEYYSAPFYSSSNGYKMQLKIYPNGDGKCKGTHVSVYVYLMKGTNDNRVKWPFTGDISIHLLNWREDNRHVKMIITYNDSLPLECRSKVTEGERAPSGFGYLDFIPHSELDYNHSNNTEYVSSDTLCFLIGNVSIPTGTDIPNWYIPPETQSPHLLPPCTIKLFNYNEHKRVSDQWNSVPFYSKTNGYKLQLCITANGFDAGKDTHLSVGVCLMKGENDENLKWPLNSEITIQLLNWREDKGHVETIIDHYNLPLEDRTRVVEGETKLHSGTREQFVRHQELEYNVDNNTEYLHNDTLCFRVSKVIIHTGQDVPSWYIPTPVTEFPYLLPPCTITMYNFSEQKRVADAWYSQPFYTGPSGYKLELRVYPNGYSTSTGTHVGVGVVLMKGENDESLKWPFDSEITLQLLNWREDKGHVEKTIDHYNAPLEYRTKVTQGDTAPNAKGIPDFISHSDLEYNANYNTEYINSDKLCFVISKIIVH